MMMTPAVGKGGDTKRRNAYPAYRGSKQSIFGGFLPTKTAVVVILCAVRKHPAATGQRL